MLIKASGTKPAGLESDFGISELALAEEVTYGVHVEPFEGHDVVYFANIGTINKSEGSAALLPMLKEDSMELVDLLAARYIYCSRGNCILPVKFKKELENYMDYLISQGLAPVNIHEMPLWVENPNDTSAVLEVARDAGKRVLPYYGSKGLQDLAEQRMVALYNHGNEKVGETREYFNNKTNFRDVYAQMVMERYGITTFPYYRLSLSSEYPMQEEEILLNLQHILQDWEDYSIGNPNEEGLQKVMFIQEIVSGGGFGNTIVYMNKDSKFRVGEKGEFIENLAGLSRIIGNMSKKTSIEVTPFLPIKGSYSLGLLITKKGVVVIGPFEQILDEKNDYQGFQVDINIKDHVDLEEQLERAKYLALRMQHSGYTAYASLDNFEFSGKKSEGRPILVAPSEVNARYTATTMLQGIIAHNPELLNKFLRGELSVMQHDHVHFTLEHNRRPNGIKVSTTSFAQKLKENGIPLFGNGKTDGVILMTTPHIHGNEGSIAIAVIANSDEERNLIFKQVENLVKNSL